VETNPLGSSGLRVSRVGLGCNNFGRRIDREETHAVVEAALEAGITFFDTADSYGSGDSERFLGEALGDRRPEVVVATKFGWTTGGAPDNVRRSLDASLERLGTDVVDLLYYHRPDGVTPLSETLDAMQALVAEGVVRALGLSNVDAALLREANASGIAVAAVQNRYSLLRRDDDQEVLPLCRELSIGYVPYYPLENGLLTGKYRRGEPAPHGSRLAGGSIPEEDLAGAERLEQVAAGHGRSLLELAVGGLASIDGIVSVIAGATSPEQVRANAAAGGWRLTPEELDALPRPVARDL
jgi:aryl-alcohol dehydrogenase-like predicted oxidoreductase